MTAADLELSAPQRLAIAYARRDLRPALALLLAFDARLADIVGRASEPMIAQMKFAWWYDAISREADSRPKGEPILRALGDISLSSLETGMVQLLDGWGILLAAEEWTANLLDEFAKLRTSAVFGTYATLVSRSDDVSEIGQTWALGDLTQRFGDRAGIVIDGLTSNRLADRKLRPLSILALSVTHPSGARMIWHALTGR